VNLLLLLLLMLTALLSHEVLVVVLLVVLVGQPPFPSWSMHHPAAAVAEPVRHSPVS
jgi:hypothetical protein